MVSPRALGHNKFLVIRDEKSKPRWVWTGSQNWTKTGLCTQANNSVLIDDPMLAAKYRDQWDLLQDAGDGSPAELKEANSKARDEMIGKTRTRLWFTPTIGQVDLNEATQVHHGREAGNPVPDVQPRAKDTLLNAIIEAARARSARQAALYPRRDQPGPEHDQEPGRSYSTRQQRQRRPTTTSCCRRRSTRRRHSLQRDEETAARPSRWSIARWCWSILSAIRC